ncbi:unnamed protein product, partial [Closterium sp. Yama58-4]
MWGFALEPTKRIGGVSPPRRPIRHRPGASRKASGILGWIPGGAGNSWRAICSPVIALVVIWLLGMIIWNSGIISLKKQTTAPSDSPTGLDSSSEYGDDASSTDDGTATDESSDFTPSLTNKMSSGGGFGGGLGTGSRAGSGAGFGAGSGAGSGAGFGAVDEGLDPEDGDGETGLASEFPRSAGTTGAGRMGGLNSGDVSRTSTWNAAGGANRGGLGADGGEDEDGMMGSGASGGLRDGFATSSSRGGMWGSSSSGGGAAGGGRFGGGGAGAGGSRWGGGGAATWGGRGGVAGMSGEDEDEEGMRSAGGGGLGVSSSRVPKLGSSSWGMDDDEGDMETGVESDVAQIYYSVKTAQRGVESAQLDDEEEEEDGMSTHRLRNVAFLRIPGTPVTGQQVLDFERQLACVSRDGLWALNSTPRWMPWDLNPLTVDRQPNYRSCDLLFAKRKGGVFGAAAERARRLPNARAAWRVRKELLYQWRPSRPLRCPFQQFDRAGFCRAVRGRNVVVVGDAFSLDWHDALLNHLVTAGTKNRAGQLGDA